MDGQAQELAARVEESEIYAPGIYADRVEVDGSVSAQSERFYHLCDEEGEIPIERPSHLDGAVVPTSEFVERYGVAA